MCYYYQKFALTSQTANPPFCVATIGASLLCVSGRRSASLWRHCIRVNFISTAHDVKFSRTNHFIVNKQCVIILKNSYLRLRSRKARLAWSRSERGSSTWMINDRRSEIPLPIMILKRGNQNRCCLRRYRGCGLIGAQRLRWNGEGGERSGGKGEGKRRSGGGTNMAARLKAMHRPSVCQSVFAESTTARR